MTEWCFWWTFFYRMPDPLCNDFLGLRFLVGRSSSPNGFTFFAFVLHSTLFRFSWFVRIMVAGSSFSFLFISLGDWRFSC